MKAKILTSIVALTAVALNGCYYSQPGKPSTSGISGTTATAAVLGGAGGAFAGSKINKDYGAPVGAAVGAVAAGGVTSILENRKAREIQEAFEDGQRRGMSQVYDEWWSEHAIMNDPVADSKAKGPKTRQIPQPAGDYESVPYHKRTYPYIIQPGQ